MRGFMNRSKTLVAVSVAVIMILAVVWYFASPAYAMNQLKSAAESGDAVELEKRIDFPKVRESLKSQLRALMAREMAKPEMADNPFGKLGGMLAMGMVDGMVEGFVTPESMAAVIEEGKVQRMNAAPAKEIFDAANAPDYEKPAQQKQVEWQIERDGFDKFTATPSTPHGEPAPSLLFERDGLGWKLSGMNLPAEGMPEE